MGVALMVTKPHKRKKNIQSADMHPEGTPDH
jgi:hypothetical protein